jgi:heptosyltransferase-2
VQVKLKKFIKWFLLYSRKILFQFLSLFTFFMRNKILDKTQVKNVLVFAQKRMGDTIVSIPTFRAIKENLPKSKITVFCTSYIKEIFERIGDIDEIITFDKENSLFQRVKQLSIHQFDLAIDLTCDYTFVGALLMFLSRAKFRIGYNTFGRGFLFHTSIPHQNQSLPMTEEILNIVRSIGLDTEDLGLKITPSDAARNEAAQFLEEHAVREEDLFIGIHPGGHYLTQRWFPERFAQVADRLMQKDNVKIVILGGPAENEQIKIISKTMQNKPMIFSNQPVRHLLSLIQSCHLLICNNSGPLHLATALETPTVSFMGPTMPKRWWPQGQGHIVLHKDLACMPCNAGICEQKTIKHECMKLITVDEVLEAVHRQMNILNRR